MEEKDEEKSNTIDSINKEKPASSFYKRMTKSENLLKPILSKCQNLDLEIDSSEFLKAFQDVNKLTNVVKLRSFQYRCLIGALVTNIHLKHYKITEDDTCTFCKESKETIMHMFYVRLSNQ